MKDKTSAAGPPLLILLRTQPRATLIVFVSAFIAVVSTTVTVFGLSYATQDSNVDRPGMLTAIALSQVVALLFHPLFGLIADRIGKKVVFVSGALACAVGTFLFFLAIQSGSTLLVIIAAIGLKGVFYAAPNGIWPSFYAEMLSADVRYTGVGIATQLSFVLTGFTPTISYALVGNGPTGWLPVALLVGGLCLLAALAASVSRPATEHRTAARPLVRA